MNATSLVFRRVDLPRVVHTHRAGHTAGYQLFRLLCRGPRCLDQCYNPLLEHPDQAPEAVEEAALPVLDLLLRQLSSTAAQHSTDGYAEVAATLAGGLAKLLMQQVLQQEGTPARFQQCDSVKVGLALDLSRSMLLRANSLRLASFAQRMNAHQGQRADALHQLA